MKNQCQREFNCSVQFSIHHLTILFIYHPEPTANLQGINHWLWLLWLTVCLHSYLSGLCIYVYVYVLCMYYVCCMYVTNCKCVYVCMTQWTPPQYVSEYCICMLGLSVKRKLIEKQILIWQSPYMLHGMRLAACMTAMQWLPLPPCLKLQKHKQCQQQHLLHWPLNLKTGVGVFFCHRLEATRPRVADQLVRQAGSSSLKLSQVWSTNLNISTISYH